MDSNTNTPPTLLIPRLTKEYIRDGMKVLNYYTFYEPEVVLNFNYPDVVLFALLAHVKKPKNILDLGSFFGLLPFAVEEIFRFSNSDFIMLPPFFTFTVPITMGVTAFLTVVTVPN